MVGYGLEICDIYTTSVDLGIESAIKRDDEV